MPFVKPKLRTFNVLLVGTGKEVTTFLKGIAQASVQNGMYLSNEVCIRMLHREGVEAKIMFWAYSLPTHSTVLPNHLHGCDIVIFLWGAMTCDGNMEKWIYQTDVHCESARKIFVSTDHQHSVCEVDKRSSKHSRIQNTVRKIEAINIRAVLDEVEEVLLEESSTIYSSLSKELTTVDLKSDKRNLANETLCFERNSIG